MNRAALCFALLVPACASLPEPAMEDRTEDARQLVDRFQTDLITALNAALADGGPVAAVEVCAEIAPAIAASLSDESGAMVRRTALRNRNPDAVPDATERRVMATFMPPLDADGKPREWSGATASSFRYMRAIPTKPMCTTCHGTAVAPDIAAAIRKRYPNDTATGFAPGDLRGAFSVRWERAR
ncbi:MAG: DUF3365 domain-containing protein [Pseudomonadota bacterium]|jgi:hypothetical protein|nr:DUF3365 domain-containing protein [Pseudomonadota bacterium]